jgi:peptidoglycan/LPS O-acetylase OafA/YrhL
VVHADEVPGRHLALHPAAQRDEVLDLLAGLVAMGLIVLVYGGQSGLPRMLLTLGFTFFVPGRAIVANWPRMARWSGAAMPMVLSLAVLALLAMVALWAHLWHPVALFQAEAWLSLAGLGIAVARRRRRPSSDAAVPQRALQGRNDPRT